MENLFVPFQIANLAKQCNFNGKCLAKFNENQEIELAQSISNPFTNNDDTISAPTYDQLILWFDLQGFEINISLIKPYEGFVSSITKKGESTFLWSSLSFEKPLKGCETKKEALDLALNLLLKSLSKFNENQLNN